VGAEATPAVTRAREGLRRNALSLIGLHAATGGERDMPLSAPGRAGFYSYADRSIVLALPGADAWVLLHEYIHALQDRDGQIGRASARAITLDEQLALRASLEGEATLYEEVARARGRPRTLEQWSRSFAERARVGDWLAARAPSVLDSSRSSFVYAHGSDYVARRRPAGPALFAPETHVEAGRAGTFGILAGAAGPAAVRLTNDEPGPERLGHARLCFSDRIGAWMIQMLLTRLGQPPEQARETVMGYRGDWLGAYALEPAAGSDGATPVRAAVLTVAWSNEDDALHAKRTFETLLDDPERLRVVMPSETTTALIATRGVARGTLARWNESLLPARGVRRVGVARAASPADSGSALR
jgi:hypothetical protein